MSGQGTQVCVRVRVKAKVKANPNPNPRDPGLCKGICLGHWGGQGSKGARPLCPHGLLVLGG
jgi:hypothetical protein